MREIKPYRTESGLMKAIDNGGRLYNIMSRSGDNVITYGELAKAAGAVSTGIYAFLFFEMSQLDLPDDAREHAVAALESPLRKDFLKNRPTLVKPSVMENTVEAGRGVIIEGYPRIAENPVLKQARVNIAISTGSGTGYEKEPLLENYNLWELFDNSEMEGNSAIIGINKDEKFALDEKIRIGGILRKLIYKDEGPRSPRRFLEAIFFTKFEAQL